MKTNKTELSRREKLRLEIIADARERAAALVAFAAIGDTRVKAVPQEVVSYWAEAGATFALLSLEARGVKF